MSTAETTAKAGGLFSSEDWLAIWLGGLILAIALAISLVSRPADYDSRLADAQRLESQLEHLKSTARSDRDPSARDALREQIQSQEKQLGQARADLTALLTKSWLAKPGAWDHDPSVAFYKKDRLILTGLLAAFGLGLVVFAAGTRLLGELIPRFVPAFAVLFLLATLAYVLAGQNVIKHYNLEYVLWALVVGLTISNTVGTPRFLLPAVRTEFYIKTGLVLLGAEILLSKLLILGIPGICMSWITTPVVLITTYWFGQRLLKMPSRSLNMVISADMSVCGVSAAIATAAACRAKKEELSLAVGISLAFTAVMMVVMPGIVQGLGLSDVVGGAWLGGTIDSTGAVAAAGGMLGSKTALEVAVTIKMIQNILIGVVAFGVAVYWVTVVDPKSHDVVQPSALEIWYRFPKFVLGFVGASLLFSVIYSNGIGGKSLVDAATAGASETMRGWLFCLAFVSIGLETNFRELFQYLKDGKAITLYVVGQSLNLAMSLFMAWLMFEKVFPQAAAALGN